MRRLLLLKILVLLFAVPMAGLSQDSFSVILEVDSANINFTSFGHLSNHFYIPVIYPGSESAIIKFDSNNTDCYNVIKVDSFDFGPEPIILFKDSSIFFYAKDRTQAKGLKYSQFTDTILSRKKNLNSRGEYNVTCPAYTFNNIAYLPFVYNIGDRRTCGYFTMDNDGNILDSFYLNDSALYSYHERIHHDFKDNLLHSTAITKQEFSGHRRAQLLKIDTSGNILWEYIPDEPMSGGAVPPWFAVLSDSTIVMNYSINKSWDDPEDWNRKLYKFVWIDQDGQFIKERYIPHHWKVDAYIADVKAGKQGDYFFTFGREEDIRDPNQSQAVLTKYNNAGDTIWHRSYAHPDFPNEDFQYSMVEMEEQDDGSFVLLAKISTARDYNKAWLFTVDSMGCFYTDSCGERLIVSSPTVVLAQERNQASLFPNPARNQLTIQSSAPFDQLVFYNVSGERVHAQQMTRTDQFTLPTHHFHPGMYIVHLRHQGRILERLKFVKI